MKAIVFDQPGAPTVMHIGDAPVPIPGPDELLIRVHATAVNRADTLQRRGHYPPPTDASPILGLELAGEVTHAAGGFQVGDRVMAVVTGGGYAEFATVPAGMAMHIPDTMTYEDAAAIPEVFLTAYLNLFTLGRLQSGETALVHAGASGVGTAAIQLIRAAGGVALATVRNTDKMPICKHLGAAHVIDSTVENFADAVLAQTGGQGVQVILDFVGAPFWNDNLRAAAMDGRLLLVGSMGGTVGQLDLGAIMGKRLIITGRTLRRTPLAQKVSLTRAFESFAMPRFADGTLKPIIDSTFELGDAPSAHQRMEANLNTGKIILRLT